MRRARDSIMPLVRNGVDKAANRASHLGYGVLPWLDPELAGRARRAQRALSAATPSLAPARRLSSEGRGRAAALRSLYIHGGAFSMMSKDTHRIMAYVLAAQGYQVFNINYRLGPVHSYPEPLKDALGAFEWVLDNGAKYGADTDRLAIIGESAGANLTAALAYCVSAPTTRAVYTERLRARRQTGVRGATLRTPRPLRREAFLARPGKERPHGELDQRGDSRNGVLIPRATHEPSASVPACQSAPIVRETADAREPPASAVLHNGGYGGPAATRHDSSE